MTELLRSLHCVAATDDAAGKNLKAEDSGAADRSVVLVQEKVP